MNWLKNKFNVTIFLQALALMLPLHHKFMPILIVLFAISTFITFFCSQKKFEITKSKVFLMIFYGFLGLGLFWTDNMKAGVFDLEVKQSLFIFPILFSFLKLSEIEFQKIIKFLIIGIFIFFIVSFYFGFKRYLNDSTFYYLFYSRLSPIVHPSYMSMYIVTAMSVLLYYIKKGVYLFYNKYTTVSIVLMLFLINVMLLSKIGILAAVLLILFYVYVWMKSEKKYKLGIVIVFGMLVFMFLSYKNVEFIKYRVDELGTLFISGDNNKSESSSGIRLHIWEHATTLVKEKPMLGHGTGDVRDVLVEKYTEHNLISALEHQYNAHNQFFQILISSGIIGLLLFLLSTYFGAKSNPLLLQFIVITFIFMSVESILENQAGTIFFGLFFSLLSQKSLTKV